MIARTELVVARELTLHPENYNHGDMAAIVESLEANGVFRPVGIQLSTGYVIYGNHTTKGFYHLEDEYAGLTDDEARERLVKAGATNARHIEWVVTDRWRHIEASWLDVDDDEADRILTVDNLSGDKRDYDYDALTAKLERMRSLRGSGVTESDLKALQKVRNERLAAMAPKVDQALTDEVEEEPDLSEVESEVAAMPTGGNKVTKYDTNVTFMPTENEWDIPELDPAMVPALPEGDYTSWNSPVISIPQDDGEIRFVYVYSTYSTRRMPWDRTILGFYIHDERFESWWGDPAHYVARYLNAGLWAMITPDWSLLSDMPQSAQLWNIYRANWVGRFAQECGLQVIPNLTFIAKGEDSPAVHRWSYDYLPKGLPTVAIQAQNNAGVTDRGVALYQGHLRRVMDDLEPETLLVYAGAKGQAMVEGAGLSQRVVYVDNRSEVKRKWRVSEGSVEGEDGGE